jgi:hypothetical protein
MEVDISPGAKTVPSHVALCITIHSPLGTLIGIEGAPRTDPAAHLSSPITVKDYPSTSLSFSG